MSVLPGSITDHETIQASVDWDADTGAGFGGDAQYYGASGPSSTNGYLDAGGGQYAQPDSSYNPSESSL